MFKTHSQTAMVSAQEVVNRKLIMLVDDDPIFRNVTNAYLESQGFKVVEAENGLEALHQLRECQPDLVLCDLSMPVLDGIEFVEEVSLEYPSLP
ncbi:response regulator, partial [Vibrio sp. Y184]